MQKIKMNFNDANSELKEGYIINGNFNWELGETPSEEFKNWFINNGTWFERSKNEAGIFQKLNVVQSTNNQCFHNSQLISINNLEIKYYEGFVLGAKYKMSIHHGFNVIDDIAIDITEYCNNSFKNSINDNWHKEDVVFYYGIYIPNEFLKNYTKIISHSNIHTPLLFDYYNYQMSNNVEQ